MTTFQAAVRWLRGTAPFIDVQYSRLHEWRFDGGAVVAASSSPHSVPVPYSVEAAVDPEEALVAAVSSCHMLWFLSISAKAGLVVDEYVDAAEGIMTRNPEGKLAITRVVLRPRTTISGPKVPSPQELAALHHRAHEECYIASSIRADIVVEPELVRA